MKIFNGIGVDEQDIQWSKLSEEEKLESLENLEKSLHRQPSVKNVSSKNKEYKERLLEALGKFKDDDSYLKDYESIDLKTEGVLLRVLRFNPRAGDPEESKAPGILIPDAFGDFVSTSNFKDVVITPVAKVIKAHPSLTQYQPGDLVLLDYDKVRGMVPNPEMQLYMQAQHARGVEAVEPEDTRPKIPRVEAVWRDFMFLRPWLYEPEEEDRSTYILPPYEIKAKWDSEAFLRI